MIWPYLFSILFVVFAWRNIYEMNYGFLDYFFSTLFLTLFSTVSFFIGLAFALLIGLAVPKHWTGPETSQLVGLRNSEGISGNFFLGTGSIDSTQYYFFYKEAGQAYQPGKIEVGDNVVIFEDKREGGELKVYTYGFMSKSFEWVAVDWQSHRYEFFIPDGSLKKNFVLQ